MRRLRKAVPTRLRFPARHDHDGPAFAASKNCNPNSPNLLIELPVAVKNFPQYRDHDYNRESGER